MVFPFIHAFLASSEPAPQYELDQDGMNALNGVLGLVENNEYYPGFPLKAAYLICGIAGS